MFFKEWCIKQLGISTITEGKIVPITVLPSFGGTVQLDSLAQSYGGYYVNAPVHGIAFSRDSYNRLC